MITKKELIGNELLREIIRIRVDALAKMLELQKKDRLPKIYEEGATGDFDNKGAIFVPGGLVLEDSDRHPIRKDKYDRLTRPAFRKLVRKCMENDNATLLFHDGFLAGVNLDNGFFAEKIVSDTGNQVGDPTPSACHGTAPAEKDSLRRHLQKSVSRSHVGAVWVENKAEFLPGGLPQRAASVLHRVHKRVCLTRRRRPAGLGENPVGASGYTRGQERCPGSALCGRLSPNTVPKACPRRDDSYSGPRRIRGIRHRHPGSRDQGPRGRIPQEEDFVDRF